MEKEKKIRALLIFEMIGRPKEHLEATMVKLIETIGMEKGVAILNKILHEAKKIEKKDKDGKIITKQELFSTFSDVEIEVDNIMILLAIVFKYMPAHLEIVYPEEFILKNVDFSSLISNLLTRLHQYDSIAKTALMQNQILAKRINEIGQGKQEVDNKDKKIKKSKKTKKK